MFKRTHPIFLLSILALCSSLSFAVVKPIPASLVGITYNGLHETPTPTSAKVNQELVEISQNFDYVRTYYPQFGGNVDLVKLAEKKVKLLVGLYLFDPPDQKWTTDNYTDYLKDRLTNNADPDIIGILVGNENIQKLVEIKSWIKQIKIDAPNIPVSTAQKNSDWLVADHELVNMVDFIAVNIYPSWCWGKSTTTNNLPPANDKCTDLSTPLKPEDAYKSFVEQFNQLKSVYPNKQIVVTETGYPTAFGKTGVSSATAKSYACQYMQKVSNWAKAEKHAVFIYEMFDSKTLILPKSQFNYNFGIKDKFTFPDLKQNNPSPNWNCPGI